MDRIETRNAHQEVRLTEHQEYLLSTTPYTRRHRPISLHIGVNDREPADDRVRERSEDDEEDRHEDGEEEVGRLVAVPSLVGRIGVEEHCRTGCLSHRVNGLTVWRAEELLYGAKIRDTVKVESVLQRSESSGDQNQYRMTRSVGAVSGSYSCS